MNTQKERSGGWQKGTKMNKNIIAIFDNELRAVAFIDDQLNTTIVGYLFKENEIKLVKLLQTLKTKNPKIRQEALNGHNINVSTKAVDRNDPLFLTAVTEELKVAGFIAKIIPEAIKSVLEYISFSFNRQQREKILPDLLNLPSDIEPEAMKELQNILLDVDPMLRTLLDSRT
jgi:hypothetical protein